MYSPQRRGGRREGKEKIYLCDLSASAVKKHKIFTKIRHCNYEIEYYVLTDTDRKTISHG